MKKFLKNLIRIVIFAFLAIIIAFLFKVVNQEVDIFGDSMHPTFNTGDIVYYNGFDIDNVKKGDIVIYTVDSKKAYPMLKLNAECSLVLSVKEGCYKNKSILHIKRVIGVENDRVEIKNHNVYINGELESFAKGIPFSKLKINKESTKIANEKYNYTYKYNKENDFYIADVKNKRRDLIDKDYGVLKKDQFFLVGDNRDISYDSRKLGIVEHKEIRGVLRID